MNLSPVFLMKFKNTVERILHVPGNYKGGILEMAVVLDHNVSRETMQDLVPQLLKSLKMHSEIFGDPFSLNHCPSSCPSFLITISA